jgi:hypothetical protein
VIICLPTTFVESLKGFDGSPLRFGGNIVETNIVIVELHVVITIGIVQWVFTTTSLTNIKLIGIVPLTCEYVPHGLLQLGL